MLCRDAQWMHAALSWCKRSRGLPGRDPVLGGRYRAGRRHHVPAGRGGKRPAQEAAAERAAPSSKKTSLPTFSLQEIKMQCMYGVNQKRVYWHGVLKKVSCCYHYECSYGSKIFNGGRYESWVLVTWYVCDLQGKICTKRKKQKWDMNRKDGRGSFGCSG